MVLRLQHNRCHGMGLFPPLHLRLCSWRRYMGGNHMGFLTYSWNDILVKSGVSWHDKVRVCKGYQIAFRHNASNTKKETCLGKQLANSLIRLHSSLHLLHILLTESCFVWNVTIPCARRLSVWVMWKSDEIGACSSRLLRRVRSLLCNGDNAEAVVKHSYLCKMKNQAGLQELISRNINIV